MKNITYVVIALALLLAACQKKNNAATQATNQQSVAPSKSLFMDVHNLEPGKVTLKDVAAAHEKDLATQGKHGVSFIKYWLDEKEGKVYCLAESPDSASMVETHKEAHGLVPDRVYKVTNGPEVAIRNSKDLYFDIHRMGAGKVTAQAVADAHAKDLATQEKFGVNFINYWVDEKIGVVMCLAEAPDAHSMIETHKQAHGLVPDEVHKVNQGN